MGKTDKDRPYWVREADPTETRYEYHGCQRSWLRRGDCDFDPHRRPEHRSTYGKNWCNAPSCTWALGHGGRPYWSAGNVPRWYVNHDWQAPLRQEERVTLRNAAREWNTHGDCDPFIEREQHRHGAAWNWD